MSTAAPAHAAVTRNGEAHEVPPVEAASGPSSAPTAPGFGSMDEDEAMTDDMRIAISALGLMREGSLSGKSPTPTPASTSLLHAQQAHQAGTGGDGVSAGGLHSSVATAAGPGRGRSDSRRSDPSRSASTASMASYSEAAWTGAGTSETGFSSPAGSMYISNGAIGNGRDTEMGDGTGGHSHAHGAGGGPQQATDDPHFIARVSQLPIVSGGIEWYERSKANSRVVKYGADLVESSFSAVSRPIANNLPLGGALDDFACRQLDRISASPSRKSPRALPEAELEAIGTDGREAAGNGTDARDAAGMDGGLSPDGASLGPGQGQLTTIPGGQRSRWQTVLLEAGGLGAAVSEESLKSLRYCLQWLLYATAHLDHHIGTLRDFIASLRAQPRGASTSSNALIAVSASAHLAQIKHDIVETIRKVVDVVSKYAGAALPEQAKRYVKQSILGLPVKWASAIEVRAGRRSRETSVGTVSMGAESGRSTPRPGPDQRMHDAYFAGQGVGSEGKGQAPTGMQDAEMYELSPTEDAADRVLTFAVESLDMLRAVTGIFGESIEKAEAWIERLRVIGVDRQRQRQAAHDDDMLQGDLPALPAPSDDPEAASSAVAAAQTSGVKRRRGAGHADSEAESVTPAHDIAISDERSREMEHEADEASAARRMRRDE
ncbi:hypothetical protein JCM10908_004019 [Rhodotorula pacifica]|uniref:transcriptional regulator OPI1 n=1 Tax=Rhodotorula pacifica TaxID=1495444 RepID=UPI0031817A66